MNETETTVPAETAVDFTEPTAEIVESTTASTVSVVDYSPVIQDATNVLANVILCGALMIVGVLLAFKLWEVPHK